MSTSEWVELIVGIVALALFLLSALSGNVAGEREQTSLRNSGRMRGNGRRSRIERPLTRIELNTTPVVQTASLILATVLLVSVLLEDRSSWRFWASVVLFASICLLIPRVLQRPIVAASSGTIAKIASVAKVVGGVERRLSARLERLLAKETDDGSVAYESHLNEVADGETSSLGQDVSAHAELEAEVLHDLEHLTVREIMVPRVDVVAVDVDDPFQSVLDTIVRAGHSRIPVFRGSIDSIVGILYAKDLLPYASANETRPIIGELVRPASIVPESKHVDELFYQMRRERVHIAVVVDEYGGMAGVVTIEDIIEELLGEIRDEYDSEEPAISIRGEGELVADGRLPISEAEELLGVTLLEDEDDFETLGGLVQTRLGRLPVAGDAFSTDRVRVEVLSVDRHRVRQVRLALIGEGNEQVDVKAPPEATFHLVES